MLDFLSKTAIVRVQDILLIFFGLIALAIKVRNTESRLDKLEKESK